jgi:hypothetical protein
MHRYTDVIDHTSFETHARDYFGTLFGKVLKPGSLTLGGVVAKSFDLVSDDGSIVGDAKWYKALKTPAAKWSTIAEYVWLLQHATAVRRFIVFGNDPSVAERWLVRYRPLASPIEFYFLDAAGHRLL